MICINLYDFFHGLAMMLVIQLGIMSVVCIVAFALWKMLPNPPENWRRYAGVNKRRQA